jgi:hypothetical protein
MWRTPPTRPEILDELDLVAVGAAAGFDLHE